MEKNIDNQIYELAYHLTPDLSEDQVPSEKEKIEQLVTSLGGSIVISHDPKKKHLSYPLRHKHYAYFGYLHFTSEGSAIKSIEDQLRLSDSVVRHLVTTMSQQGPNVSILLSRDPKTRRPRKPGQPGQAQEGAKEAPPMDKNMERAMETELEGVLGKL